MNGNCQFTNQIKCEIPNQENIASVFFLNEDNKEEIIYILEDQGICLTIKPCMVYTNL